MKKTVKILGIFVFSAIVFSMSNRIQNNKTMSLGDLVALNTANAEEGGSAHGCYDTFVLGNTYTAINCSGCKAQKCDQYLDANTCP